MATFQAQPFNPPREDSETGCKSYDAVAFESCKQAFYLKQQNQILQHQQTDTKLQQENTELKSQLQAMQKEIESLKSRQTVQLQPQQGNQLTASIRNVPLSYSIAFVIVFAIISVVIWKVYLRKIKAKT